MKNFQLILIRIVLTNVRGGINKGSILIKNQTIKSWLTMLKNDFNEHQWK